MAKIKKGDQVVVTSGKDKGVRGEVMRVLPSECRVVVAGVNVVRRHQRQTPRDLGGVIERESPIHLSNVALLDPESDRPTRIGFCTDKDGRKIRIARRSGVVIDS
ncbi:MAG: 50S ribosomal protein L24 [Rhodospirillales bacterium]|nr:50S ribosomal protein L24 [Rhodospirillales bacterium]